MEFFMRNLSSLLLWIGSLIAVALLAYLKEAPEETKSLEMSTSSPRWEIPHLETSLGIIALHPVSVAEYERFTKATGYRTWRERHHCSPCFRDEASDTYARWLTRADAQAYCDWLSSIWGGELEVGLPSKEALLCPELDFALDWEWTGHSLADFDPDFLGASRYHSAYNPKTQSLRHRREEDSHDTSIADTGFRVGWGLIRRAR